MKINKIKFYTLFFSFLFLLNMIAGGFLPLGEGQKDFIKVGLLLVNLISIFSIKIKSEIFKIVLYYGLLVGIFLTIPMFSSFEMAYALQKVDALLLCVPFSIIILLKIYTENGTVETIKTILVCGLILLILTVIYKLNFGFWDRNTRYFLNGANVFGWLMGLYTILSIYLLSILKRKIYLIFSFFFFLGVLWSQSKGALISTLLCSILVLFYYFKGIKLKLILTSLVAFLIIFFNLIQIYLYNYFPNSRLLAIFRVLEGNLDESDQGSVGIRSELLKESMDLFLQHPYIGVGLGNFKYYSMYNFDYPHNAHVEIFTENGLIVGCFYLAFVLIGLLISPRFLKILILYFLLVSTFSGDLSYLRFAFLIILFGFCLYNYNKSRFVVTPDFKKS